MITYTFLLLIIISSIYCFNNRETMNKFLFHPYSIYHNKEHYRFLTHAFIHGDTMHLLFNCLALFSFGIAIEEDFFPYFFGPQLGKLFYIILFTGGIYAASLTEYIRNRNNPDYSSLGASGAISSIMFSYIIMSPKSTVALLFFPMPGWVAGALLLGVSYYLIQRKKKGSYNDNISHESHFWGAIFGIVFVLVLKPSLAVDFIKQIIGAF
jgi:membrane associated rhomboid family serine protease